MKTKLLYVFLVGLFLIFSCESESDNSNSLSSANSDTISTLAQDDGIDDVQIENNNQDDFFEFAFVSSNKYIVLDTMADESIATGNAYAITGYADQRFTSVKDIEADKIPEKYKDLVGKIVFVGTESGGLFEAEISSIKIMAECIPHFGIIQQWEGEFDDHIYTDAEKSEQIWDMGAYFIVAEFETTTVYEDDEIIFALPLKYEKCCVYATTNNHDEKDVMYQQIIDNLSSTKIYKNYQTEYSSIVDDGTNWWNALEFYEIFSFFESVNGETYVALYQIAGNPCGGEYYLPTFSVTKFRNDGLVENMYQTDEAYYLITPIDYNNDGVLEYIISNFYGKRILIYWGEPDWENKYEWEIPFLDCGC